MALTMHMPTAGCEHMNDDSITKIREFRSTHLNGEDLVQYTCLECSTTGSFPTLDKHFTETKHDLAVSHKTVYCGHCNDLVYDPTLLSTGKKRKLAETNEDDDSYLTSNTSQRPCGRNGVRGLFNLGETCYMNAVLQMMVHNPLLASYFLGMGHPTHTCPISKEPEKKNESDSEDDDEEKKEQQTCVACGMTEVFSDVTMVDQPTPAHAVNLLFASWKNIPAMSGKGQQDAQEWFMYIVDRLHEAVAQYKVPEKTNRVNEANGIPPLDKQCVCFFHKVFYGRYNNQITCDTCHTVSSREDEFSSISLDFKKQVKKKKKAAKDAANASDTKDKEPLKIAIPNIHECLRSFTAPEPLSPEQYSCQECKERRSASKQTRIRKLPAILCVHVKRFGMKQLGTGVFVPEKYEGRLEFGLQLDMAPYTTRPPKNGEEDAEKYMYDLDCVVVHQGEHAQNGHYFAFCRQDNKWFRFDDEIVSATTTEDVMRQEAYLLFYSLRRIEKV
ncbi:hypothetical protein LTR47_008834 [Exophiala xenobiotica]|nr:hypothetical protein LTR72_010505 [Exophiala xenobiotica]KAK5226606.1 hypothetical protein LTR47_008834 [Exophiala xenobiotica]KAK5252812.1 hypothetical protein LTS06_002760 [Exophiala xenobiotica]KAK5296185.1 hypothetical protein LTR14_003816 [Exophiala xenobiotica]KAK5318668.1 hypothetical protein LTR93_008063 [Exophiala xenobiotica]